MSTEVAEELHAPRSGRRLLPWGVVVVAVLVGAGVAAWLAYGRNTSSSDTNAAPAVSTTVVRVGRRNLAETQTFSGTLGYANEQTVTAQTQGTITAIAAEGSIRRRGGVLFRVNDLPTVLMGGTVPAWRALSSGMTGPDVQQLERNLVALGYDPSGAITVDDYFGSGTTAAVERWQEALGVPQTGVVALGDVVFLPGPRRIGQQTATVGSSVQPGSAVLTASSTRQQVTVQLDATDQTLAVAGRRVTVDLPDGSSVPGLITSVGKVAQSSAASSTSSTSSTGSASSSGSSSSTDTSATIEVDIALLRGTGEALDQAPVDVDLTTDARRHVLAVPVTALIALLGGGYAVEQPATGGGTHLVAVKPGLYGGGYVEITSGLHAGDRVVVPAQQ